LLAPTRTTALGKRNLEQNLDKLALNASHSQHYHVINNVVATKDTKAVVFETIPSSGHDRDRKKQRRLELFNTNDLKAPLESLSNSQEIILDNTIQDLAGEVSKLVGTYQNQIVFFNHQQWLCTWQIGTNVSLYKKHFFLPEEWATSEALALMVLSELGTLLCPRSGEVAIITSGLKF
jgi:hypothetical protein